MVYAEQWRPVAQSLPGPRAEAVIDECTRFLDEHADEDVLCSNELFTSLLWTEERREAFVALLAAAGEIMPVTCIWTLRRVDDLVVSYYLWTLSRRDPSLPVRQLTEFPRVEASITGSRALECAGVGRSVYVKYEAGGGHNAELLEACGLPAELVVAIEGELAGTRHNAAPSHKQAVALLNPEALSARSGVSLDRPELREAFARGGFQFENDGPCALVDETVRRVLRERAMTAARDCGFAPYIRLFGDAEFADSPQPVNMSADDLDDEDLAQLLNHLQGTRADHATNV